MLRNIFTIPIFLVMFVSTVVVDAFAEGYEDVETANIITDDIYNNERKKGKKKSEFTCILLLQDSDGVVENEEVIRFSVIYMPAISGSFEERLTINWPSSVRNLSEKTVRTKAQFLEGSATVDQSDVLVVVPGARGIKGFFRPTVRVQRIDGTKVCKTGTDGLIEVVNP